MRATRKATTAVVLNISTLDNNLDKIKLLSPYKIISVLKSNAYGLGINNIIPVVSKKVYKIAINNIEEFLEHELYKYSSNFITLFPELDEEMLNESSKYPNLELSINSEEMLKIISRIKDRSIKVHLEVDTGMNRTGIRYDKIIDLPKNINLVGIYTHLKNDLIEDNLQQIINFYDFLYRNNFEYLGKDIGILNSVGVLNYQELKKINNDKLSFMLKICNNVRVGILQYGIVPSYKYVDYKKEIGLENCVKIEVGFLGTKKIRKGETIGYTFNKFVAHEDYNAGLAFLGYSKIPFCKELYFEIVTNKRKIITNSLGSISMDIVAFDLKDISEDEEIKSISFIDNIEYLANRNGLPIYSFLTSLNSVKKITFWG